MLSHRLLSGLFVATLLLPTSQAVAQERILFDFDNPQLRGRWQNVNDGVMGGVSDGRHGYSQTGDMLFFGNLSLANNGGFASVRSSPSRLNLQAGDELLVRVRGDGRKYYLDVRSPSNRMAFSYRVSIQTQAGKWQEFRVPMSMFVGTSFGRTLPNARPVAAQVNSIGFTLSDKREGPFKLEVDSIRVRPAATIKR